MRQGFYEDSRSLLEFQLPPQLGGSDIAVWQALTQASDLTYLEHFAEAQPALERARNLAASSQPQLLGEVLLRTGTWDSLQWKLREATENYHRALDFARKQHDPFLEIASLGSLGLAAARMEHYDESAEWNKQALQLSESIGAMSSAARIEGNIGWSYYQVGNLEAALSLYEKAAADSEKAGLPEKRITWLINSGTVHYDLREYDAAVRQSLEARQLSQELKDVSSNIDCLQNLAITALARHEYAAAGNYLAEAIQLEGPEPDPMRQLYTQLITAHLAAQTSAFSKAEGSYSNIIHNPAAPASLRWEAQAGLAQVHAATHKSARAEHEFEEAIATITEARDALQREEFRLSFLSSAIRFYDAYVNFLMEQKRPLDALKIAERSRAQTMERGLSSEGKKESGQTANFRPMEAARRLGATLLFYWLGEQNSYLWAITPSKISVQALPGKAGIDAAVKSYRESFTEPRDPLEAGNADGKKLYATLVEPVARLIPKNARVIILPDGSLNALNFETLIVPGPRLHYWIEDVTVLTTNSLALLSRTTLPAPPKSGNLLLFGDPLSASADFPALPQAGKEVSLVEKYFPAERRTLFTGAQATASRFLSGKPEGFAYLHFATHGTASTTRPLESAVILSPEGDSYKLYARDIVQHPLNAYLVTISACNGAGMRTYAGEGLVGLAWAFLRAGAHHVIGGLWEVSNASTPQLMDELYKGLSAGQDPATALRNAKLTLVHSTGNYRKPFYWAPFQLYAGS